MKPQRIALYGGTFDPVHNGHLTVARVLLRLFKLDTVLFIPAHIAPHKRGTPPTSPLHRYAMLALATQHEPQLRLSTVELEAPERPYTVETLARLQSECGVGGRLFFVMGADSWAEVTMWREWERLLSMSDHLVVTRPGHELTTAHVGDVIRQRVVDLRGADAAEVAGALAAAGDARKIYLTDAVFADVSATEIRRAVARRVEASAAAIEPLPIPPPVAEYIAKHRLYRDTHDTEQSDRRDRPAHG